MSEELTSPGSSSAVEAAPATEAPAALTPEQRPQTLEEAFAQDEAPAEPEAPAATAPAAETPETKHPSDNTPGPRLADHKKILENTRAKTRAEVESEYQSRYPWLSKLTPEEAQGWVETARSMAESPIQFLQDFAGKLREHPVWGPQLRSEAARMLASQRTEAPPEPDVEILDGAGNVVGKTYSDAALQKRDEWLSARIAKQFQSELAPLKQSHEQAKAQQQHAEFMQAVEHEADTVLADVTAIVGQDEAALKAVAEAMDANPQWTAQRAAAHVFETLVKPGLTTSTKAQVLDELKTRAAASTLNPSAAAVTSTTRPTSLLDPGLKWD